MLSSCCFSERVVAKVASFVGSTDSVRLRKWLRPNHNPRQGSGPVVDSMGVNVHMESPYPPYNQP
jgi:hypothetical protein